MKAVVFGVTGQMGYFLSQLLLSLNYTVVGVCRRSSVDNRLRLQSFADNPRFIIEQGDITDAASVFRILSSHQPNKVFNLAAQSHVKVSFDEPIHSTNVDYVGVLNILEAIRLSSPHSRFVQCSSSEMFGSSYSTRYVRQDGFDSGSDQKWVEEKFQNEDTEFRPNSSYAVAKLAAHHACRLYRESYGTYAASSILFNYESEYRGENFVTRKITKYVGLLKKYLNWFDRQWHEHLLNYPKLVLGNLEAKRDWGFAGDSARALYLLSEQSGKPKDYVVATGETHSVREFLSEAFSVVGIDDWTPYVNTDSKYFRPCEVDYLRGDASKIKSELGWSPKLNFKDLVKRMVKADCDAA